ncbi:MAG: 50S ribosomal protein L17 [bacterium]
MRHKVKGKKLGRTSSHRKAMFCNMVTSLLCYHRIRTTHTKALEARRFAERIINHAKSGTLHARRLVAKVISDKKILKKLFDDIAPVYKEREGGYTRVLKIGERKGDNALMSILELVGIDPNNHDAVVPYDEKRAKPKASSVRKKKISRESVKMEEKKSSVDKAEKEVSPVMEKEEEKKSETEEPAYKIPNENSEPPSSELKKSNGIGEEKSEEQPKKE